jgi:hypothetical protein
MIAIMQLDHDRDHSSDFGSLSTCRVLSSSLLTCLHDFVHVPRLPNLENVATRQRQMLSHELYSMIRVPRLKDENAAELFIPSRCAKPLFYHACAT